MSPAPVRATDQYAAVNEVRLFTRTVGDGPDVVVLPWGLAPTTAHPSRRYRTTPPSRPAGPRHPSTHPSGQTVLFRSYRLPACPPARLPHVENQQDFQTALDEFLPRIP